MEKDTVSHSQPIVSSNGHPEAAPSGLADLLARVEKAEGRPCEHCGATMLRPAKLSQAQWERRRFCSRTCNARSINARIHQQTVAERLTALSERDRATGCRNWTGPLSDDGYGKLTVANRSAKAHRLAYETFAGPVEGRHVLHRCDNRRCIEPDHLFLGSNADNTADRNAKGRQARGESHARAKLTERDVRAIRSSVRRIVDLAADCGVGETAISNIIHRRSWAHVGD